MLQSMGLQRVRHFLVTEQQQQQKYQYLVESIKEHSVRQFLRVYL